MPKEDKLVTAVTSVVSSVYDKILTQFKPNSEEIYTTAGSIRRAAVDSLFYVSQARGSLKKGVSEYDWSYAGKSLNSLRTMIKFASKQKLIRPSDVLVKQIDGLIKQVEAAYKEDAKDKKQNEKEELKPWLEKYKLWQQMNKNN